MGDGTEKIWNASSPKRDGGEKREKILSPLKRELGLPPSLLAHYIPAHFPHHFSNDSSAEGYIARVDPLFPLYLFFLAELLLNCKSGIFKLNIF